MDHLMQKAAEYGKRAKVMTDADDDKQMKATGSTRSRGSDEGGNLKARSSGGLRAKGSAVSSGGAFSSFASQGSRGSSR